MKCGGTRRDDGFVPATLSLGPFLPLNDVRGMRATVSNYSVASCRPPKQRGLLRPQHVSFAVASGWRLFIGNQNNSADNDQNYSCKFRKGELFTKQEPDHHSGCNSPRNTNGSANRDR